MLEQWVILIFFMDLEGLELLPTDCPTLSPSEEDATDDVLLTALAEQIVEVEGDRVALQDSVHSVN